jgi:hypothetical protein
LGKLTEEQKMFLRPLFDARPEHPCLDCGGYHLRSCPRIRSQEWIGNGNRIKVEYWQHGQYDDSDTIYPEDVFEPEGEDD